MPLDLHGRKIRSITYQRIFHNKTFKKIYSVNFIWMFKTLFRKSLYLINIQRIFHFYVYGEMILRHKHSSLVEILLYA